MISRERARQVAELHLRESGAEGRTLGQVVTLEELRAQVVREPGVLGVDLSGSWIAYVRPPSDEVFLRASWIIAVSRTTGEVVYDGSADDEG